MICRLCRLDKPEEDFQICKSNTSGRQGKCKQCGKDQKRLRRLAGEAGIPMSVIDAEYKRGPRKPKPLESHYVADGKTGCWNWKGKPNKQTGYGKKTWEGKDVSAHRWVYEQVVGRIEKGKVIDHLCRNRLCVNPDHLEVVDQQTSAARADTTILDWDKVRQIRERLKTLKRGQRDALAEEFGVTPQTISNIKYGRSWKE